jgi:hypothetical protein
MQQRLCLGAIRPSQSVGDRSHLASDEDSQSCHTGGFGSGVNGAHGRARK